MKTNKTITLLGKELTISHEYKTEAHGYGFAGVAEAIEIDLKELTKLIKSEEEAERLTEEMTSYIYSEVYNRCKSQAEEGEALYSYRTIMIDFGGIGRYNNGNISASAMYSELCECHKIGISSYIDKLPEEDEDGEEIPENVRFNKVISALEACGFCREMSERELIDFERLEEEARENYRRLHPEEFDEEEDN